VDDPASAVVAKTAPSAMKAPARIASTKSRGASIDVFATPIVSARSAI
jgi:hypothetical protein